MSSKIVVPISEFVSNIKRNPTVQDDKVLAYYVDVKTNRVYLSGRRNPSTAAMVKLVDAKKVPFRCVCCKTKAKHVLVDGTVARPFAENGKEFTIDHIKPRHIGGKDSIDNYQIMCKTCNTIKGGVDISNTFFLRLYVKAKIYLSKKYPKVYHNKKSLWESTFSLVGL
jgi:hypothetical protein